MNPWSERRWQTTCHDCGRDLWVRIFVAPADIEIGEPVATCGCADGVRRIDFPNAPPLPPFYLDEMLTEATPTSSTG